MFEATFMNIRSFTTKKTIMVTLSLSARREMTGFDPAWWTTFFFPCDGSFEKKISLEKISV